MAFIDSLPTSLKSLSKVCSLEFMWLDALCIYIKKFFDFSFNVTWRESKGSSLREWQENKHALQNNYSRAVCFHHFNGVHKSSILSYPLFEELGELELQNGNEGDWGPGW